MQSLIDIALVMLAAGSLGGLVNYFIADPEQEKPLPWWQHVVVGVVAAFMVPLFLNMISGDLIDKIRGIDGKPGDYSKLFVLAGFCLVAAVSSRAFIRTLSERVLREVRTANKKAEAASKKADQAVVEAETAKEQATAATVDATEARQAVAPFVEDDGPEDSVSGSQPLRAATENEQLSADERAILKVMKDSSFALRSMTGIAKDGGLERSAVSAAITSLLAKDLIGETIGKSGQPRWFLTKNGRLTNDAG
ncbi:MAG: hypothetical protein D4R93_04220 [Deltaproteobacteria bacterium]|nr:MAG: hypothetical protein D4R93_04220 [Deltaproteobacteria bacterium]